VPVRSLTLASLILAACGGAAAPATAVPAAATPATSSSAAATPAASVSASGPWTFTIDTPSKVTVRVREVLAQIRAPGDAVLSTSAVKGSFTLNADGTFAATSKITVDLTTLRSDQSQRDQFIKDNTLETRRFPTAAFTPSQASGLPLPLPANADMKFTLTGEITIHGVTKTVSFAITATRAGSRLTATAVAEPAWKFAAFGMTVPRVASVLSIEDDIRVEIALVATETG
jgi:polyisoprenoid-binding protein YceI